MEHTANATMSPYEALQALAADPELKRLEDLLAEFNLFDTIGIAKSELHHSKVIAWLLNPRGSHGLDDHFLRGFLSQAASEARERGIHTTAFGPSDVDVWNFSDIEVVIEYQTSDGRIDILLVSESNNLVCPIENKIDSDEHSEQLARYLQDIENEYKDFIRFPIFLTPDGRTPQDDADAKLWTSFDYEKIADLIRQVLETHKSKITASVSSFLEQYERTLRRRILNTPSDIDKLALQIYGNHSNAIDIIRKVVPSPADMYWDIVEPTIALYTPDLKHDDTIRTIRRFFAPNLDNILPSIKEGKYWTDSGRMILFEFKYMGNMEIWLTVGPGPEETRERLYQLAQRVGTPFKTSRSKRMGDWFYIYSKPILDRQDFNTFDPDKARTKIEKAIADFFQDDYWPLVNTIRQEFGLPSLSPS